MSAVTANNVSSSAKYNPYMVAYDVVHLQYEVSSVASSYIFSFPVFLLTFYPAKNFAWVFQFCSVNTLTYSMQQSPT
jgi:hypothetical protein